MLIDHAIRRRRAEFVALNAILAAARARAPGKSWQRNSVVLTSTSSPYFLHRRSLLIRHTYHLRIKRRRRRRCQSFETVCNGSRHCLQRPWFQHHSPGLRRNISPDHRGHRPKRFRHAPAFRKEMPAVSPVAGIMKWQAPAAYCQRVTKDWPARPKEVLLVGEGGLNSAGVLQSVTVAWQPLADNRHSKFGAIMVFPKRAPLCSVSFSLVPVHAAAMPHQATRLPPLARLPWLFPPFSCLSA